MTSRKEEYVGEGDEEQRFDEDQENPLLVQDDDDAPEKEQTLVTLDDDEAPVVSDDNPNEQRLYPLASPVQREGPPPYRRKLVFLYVLAIGLLHADYNLLAPNLTEVAEEFGMSTDERDRKLGGEIALSFFLCGVPSALIVGWMTDRLNHRAVVFATVIFIGELSCFATYFVRNFAGLLATRSITGIAIGASLPVVYSVLGDLYQAQGRNAISGLIATSMGLGLGIGQAIAGYVGPTFGWRLPFLIVSIPSFFVGFLAFFLPEPSRGGQEKAILDFHPLNDHVNDDTPSVCQEELQNYDIEDNQVRNLELYSQPSKGDQIGSIDGSIHREEEIQEETVHRDCHQEPYYIIEMPSSRTTCNMLRVPSVVLLLVQGAPNVIPFGITSVFLNDYLSQDKGLTTEQATSVLLTFGTGNAFGVIIGSSMGHFFYKKDVRYPALLMGSSIILTTVPMYFVINMKYDKDGAGIATASAMTFLAGLLSIFPIPIERAILTNVTLPETRGRANSFLSIIDDLGKGLGPFLLSRMISSWGRTKAFNLSLIGWLVGGFVSLIMFWTVAGDEDFIQDKIRQKIVKHRGHNDS